MNVIIRNLKTSRLSVMLRDHILARVVSIGTNLVPHKVFKCTCRVPTFQTETIPSFDFPGFAAYFHVIFNCDLIVFLN